MSESFDSAKGYRAFKDAEWWCVFGVKNIAFRFGPFDGPAAGKIMTRCVQEQIPMTLVVNCGNDIDWDLVRDTRGDLTQMNFFQRWCWRRRERQMQKLVQQSKGAQETNAS